MAHTCHAVGCSRRVPPKMLCCAYHWHMVPFAIQRAVWKAYVPGQETRKDPTDEYMAAHCRAVAAVARKEGKLKAAAEYEALAAHHLED